jgi:two-component system, LytTR family, sensor kinase
VPEGRFGSTRRAATKRRQGGCSNSRDAPRRAVSPVRWTACNLRRSDVSPFDNGPTMLLMARPDDHSFPTFWRLQALGWTGLYALTVLDALPYIGHDPASLWRRLGASAVICGIFFLVSCCLLRPICRSLVERSLSWFQLQLRAFGWASLIGGSIGVLVQFAALHFPEPDWNDLISNYVRYTILLMFWCNLYFSIKQWKRSIQEREDRVRAEADAREARLSALRYQLNPHFLFNSLNAVSTLAVEGDVPASTRMLAQIADLLRVTLDGKKPFEVTLSEEMTFTERYLAIEQTRLGHRLQVELALAADTFEAAVPSMLLQPLVENAVRHGIAPVVGGGRMAIRSERKDQMLRIVISNTGPRSARPRETPGGIGLANTIERLRTMYGPNHRFELEWPETGGCNVLIEIPFRRVPQRLEELACAY